jgi:hypothetical protein
MSRDTFFERIARSLTVGEISDRLVSPVSSRSHIGEIFERFIDIPEEGMQDTDDWFCLVKEGKHTLGFIFQDSEAIVEVDSDEVIGDHFETIRPEQIVSYELPILAVLPILMDEFYMFVQTGNEITHVLTYPCLDKIPFRHCLLSLMLEAEHHMQRIICRERSKADRRFQLLSQSRQQKAYKLFNSIHSKKRDKSHIILYTMFTDKVAIFLKDHELQNRLPFASKSSGERFFKKMEETRNAIAHGRSLSREISDLPRFVSFIDEVTTLTRYLSDYDDRREAT